MEEINLIPRDYQKAIFETCKEKNCLVVLPTGTGKTLIALMLSIERFKQFPLQKILMLAPTRPLAEQHLASFKKLLPEDWAQLDLFTGKTEANKRKEIWQRAEFIFSTPQCIANDIQHSLYDLSEVCLLIEDEAHRCMKNYSYRFISERYREQSKNPHILGLTASPGSDKETITRVCDNLGIESVEIRTRESEDVKPYLQELEFEKINVDFPPEFEEIRILLKEIYNEKVDELKNRKVLFTFATKTTLLETQRKIMRAITSGNKNGNLLMSASACATAIKLQHALELIETQTLSSFISYLKELLKQANEKKSKGVQRLVSDKRFMKAYTLATTISFEHPKLNKLKEIVKEQLSKNEKSKIIIFTQYRDTVNKICEELNKIEKVRASSFVGQAKKIHGSGKNEKISGLNQKEQKEIINKFSNGEINVLVATSIAEEGLDIPEVNEVIFYEPVPSAIRTIQRRGRTARLSPGSLKILVTKDTRDQSFHYAAISREKKMHKAIEQIQEEMEEKGIIENQKEKQEVLF